jgi:hypothetical protein
MSAHENLSPAWRNLTRLLGILLIAALLAGMLPQQASASTQTKSKCDLTYQVRSTDTLSSIASKFNRSANEIVYVNKWDQPYTIYVGQTICLPEGNLGKVPKIDSKYLNAPAVYFIAGRSGDSIMIYTFNYPKTTAIVRVQNAKNTVKNLVTIGTISQVANGKTYRFKLPASLQNVSQLMVCLKDRTTSYLQCVYPRSGS